MKTQATGARRRNDAGFTLVEMLVALAILAAFASYLPSAFRLVRHTWQASAKIAADDPVPIARSLLAARLAEAMPLFERARDGDRIAFAGTAASISFIAPLRSAPQGAGLYHFRLYLDDSTSPPALAISIASHIPAQLADGAFQPAQEVHRLFAATDFTVRYFGRPSLRAEPGWQAAWTRNDALPDLVELRWRDAKGQLTTPLAVELRLRSGR